MDRLKEIHFRQSASEPTGYQQTLEDYFRMHPPATIKEGRRDRALFDRVAEVLSTFKNHPHCPRGVPVGSDIEYIDQTTLQRTLEGHTAV